MRNALCRLHRWFGITLALPLIIEATTGFILAITPVWHSLTALPPSSAVGPVSRPAAIISAAHAFALDLVPIRYHPGNDPHGPVSVDLALPGQRTTDLRVMIDPVTLGPVATLVQPDEFYRSIRGLHERLLIPAIWGRSVIGWVGVGLLVLSISGVPIWWNSGQRSTARSRPPGFPFWRGLHRGVGICLAAVLAMQAASGIALAFPQTFRSLLGAQTGLPVRRNQDAPPPIPDVDAILAQAFMAVPNARVRDLLLPSTAGMPAVVSLQPDIAGVATVVFVDPLGQKVLAAQDLTGPAFGTTVLLWLRALHAGSGLGNTWRTLVCVAGLLLPLLPLSGLAMWSLRRRGQQAIRGQTSLPVIVE